MRQRQISWQPDAALGIPVYGCAALVFPLHLGWTGSPWAAFAAYLALATLLFWAVDRLARPRLNQLPTFPQGMLFLLAIGIPATFAFAIGTLLGPIDERLDEQACQLIGATENDMFGVEGNDTFDLTPDCIFEG
ncbi:hypothetical protein J4558_01725 [Leptolyngbya sp. 15MV]|nr:hypothetical protein J4558_01725 [Leptolyngbya sp. 15MV]